MLRGSATRAFPALFFGLTVLSTLLMGTLHSLAFYSQENLEGRSILSLAGRLHLGLPFCLTLMGIIGSHELGHYLTARRYRVDSSLPVFIPFPFSLVGTLGASIIIKSPFPHRRSLIDIGLAGPFAGFLVCLPALYFGLTTARAVPEGALSDNYTLGEPLLLRAASALLLGPSDVDYLLSPVGLAAWFGLLLTAINLLPIGQLDGGHAAYAIFGERAHRISRIAFFALIPMSIVAPTWLFFALFAYALGIRRPHPPTIADEVPLPLSRKVMGALGLATFLLCFTPEPIQISWSDMFAAFTSASN